MHKYIMFLFDKKKQEISTITGFMPKTPGMSLWNIAATHYLKRHLDLLIQQLDL